MPDFSSGTSICEKVQEISPELILAPPYLLNRNQIFLVRFCMQQKGQIGSGSSNFIVVCDLDQTPVHHKKG